MLAEIVRGGGGVGGHDPPLLLALVELSRGPSASNSIRAQPTLRASREEARLIWL